MKDTDWARTGEPLLEPDAEYLKSLLEAEGFPVDIVRSDDEHEIESGRCYFVRVQAMHLRFAKRIYANTFKQRANDDVQPGAQTLRWQKRELIGAGAATGGCLLGIPVALIFKGGALMAVLAGGAFSLIAMLMTLVITVGSGGPPTVQQQGGGVTTTHVATRRESGERRKD
ncbi:MAG: hypothetical protein KF696_08350 [Planctomycetes bacterium]|nr:hypothetical protein [Planctomycetota bacterium]MCW8135638.1 hypothetical protein [Planctomycetota bacterium]